MKKSSGPDERWEGENYTCIRGEDAGKRKWQRQNEGRESVSNCYQTQSDQVVLKQSKVPKETAVQRLSSTEKWQHWSFVQTLTVTSVYIMLISDLLCLCKQLCNAQTRKQRDVLTLLQNLSQRRSGGFFTQHQRQMRYWAPQFTSQLLPTLVIGLFQTWTQSFPNCN